MKIQKRLASTLLGVSPKRVWFSNERIADINEAITKRDIRMLIAEGAIQTKNEKGVSRGRARKIKTQKSKNKQIGPGSRKGTKTAGLPRKTKWMNKIRSQREFLQELRVRNTITNDTFRKLYMMSKGGYFRSTRHIKIYLEENTLFTKESSDKKAQKLEKKPVEEKTVEKKERPKKVAAPKKKKEESDEQ